MQLIYIQWLYFSFILLFGIFSIFSIFRVYSLYHTIILPYHGLIFNICGILSILSIFSFFRALSSMKPPYDFTIIAVTCLNK